MAIRVTFWHEFRHEKTVEKVKSIYPDGLHAYLKSCLECDDIKITLAALDESQMNFSRTPTFLCGGVIWRTTR